MHYLMSVEIFERFEDLPDYNGSFDVFKGAAFVFKIGEEIAGCD